MKLENIIWTAILAFLFLIITILNLTGKIYYFLHPRLFIYSLFASFMLLILLLFEIYKMFREKHNHHHHTIKIIPYFMFIIFILVAAVYQFENASSNIAKNKDANYSFSLMKRNATIKDGLIEVDNKNYLDVLDELHRNLDNYIGREIVIDGFVFRDKSFEKNQFVVARMLVTCCAADAQIVGLLVEGKCDYKDDEWIMVKGTIEMGDYNGETIPTIRAKNVNKIDRPKEEYIYP